MMFYEIPLNRPNTPLLDSVPYPSDLRKLSLSSLPQLADELRAYLLWCTGQTGGHFGAGLGVIELTIALHYVYDTPFDRLLWDVGHQAYPHKILTGRKEQMLSMRQKDGLAAFPNRAESEYDTFGVGHSSTSISAALGMSLAARQQNSGRKVAAIIGDGAMTAGMAFEALNDAAHNKADMLVILNDNQMSISHNVGGLSNYLARIWSSKQYIALREEGKKVLATMPTAWNFARRTEESVKHMTASTGTLFEAIGFNTVGPIDGHDVIELVRVLRNLRKAKGPQLLHLYTTKGKGFAPAEADPIGYHAITKIAPASERSTSPSPKKPKYSDVFGEWLCDMAAEDSRLIGITPAMCEGSGMVKFAKQFPNRFHDVAIAEQHAVTLAAGMACEGLKPVVAIYSTFLQRGYDQLVHDVALQNLDVTFGIDRAGLVGEDGPTHAGAYDYAYMRTIPNIVICAPADENECRQLLYTAYQHQGCAAVRYPRGTGTGVHIDTQMTAIPIGKGEIKRLGQKVAILAFGSMLSPSLQAAENLNATVANMRFVKPLDEQLIRELAQEHSLLVTVEEHAIMGGAGSAVNEFICAQGLGISVLNLGIPDAFIEHASHSDMLKACGLDAQGIINTIKQRIAV
ncbi:MAG TPA: 1-deoxy-D-xylulose-5-phosphate synthase [Agitococcus sp.]|nr:1-deoxy-D-xylulose-5-phosphate synthase [Agitococcus sp.]HMY28718.1 1-deoxy-D-xylulose-5-phosphate synthase [Agitococcus sp.]HNB20601.1 1-deoxy-D-xylulose-5-phosphate synthase [Agitococcus sp.]HNC03524.1 1-deoxy-D-xylulose-5-phosphate synthase [Agitococcus sp.]HNC87121.1 1-deoxy-D-xylulose-5-phosphate synthase [Agitococcus sp.]